MAQTERAIRNSQSKASYCQCSASPTPKKSEGRLGAVAAVAVESSAAWKRVGEGGGGGLTESERGSKARSGDRKSRNQRAAEHASDSSRLAWSSILTPKTRPMTILRGKQAAADTTCVLLFAIFGVLLCASFPPSKGACGGRHLHVHALLPCWATSISNLFPCMPQSRDSSSSGTAGRASH